MATSVPVINKTEDGWKGKKARSLCWTLNNYSNADVESLRIYAKECKYLVFGYEVAPTTGTPHLQGYVAWENPRSIAKFISIFTTKGVHVEKTRGTPKQASDYCKEDGKYEEFGEIPSQGERTDWKQAVEDLKTKDITTVIEEQPQMLPCIRALERYKALTLKPIHREVNVVVIYGQAGSGKTRYCYDRSPELYSKPIGQWWDGYTGQKEILLDDYYGYLPYSELLRVLDRYPYQVPIKGGYVQAQWDTVYITSNDPPSKWYQKGLTPALERRLKNIYYCYILEDGSSCFEAQGAKRSFEEAEDLS